MNLTRKEFLSTVMTAVAGAAGAALFTACSSDSGDDDSGGDCLMNGTTVQIGTNHGHSLTVPKADVMAGVAKTYDIRGTSDHPHTVTINAAAFAMLAAGQSAMTVSSTDGHSHNITINCA